MAHPLLEVVKAIDTTHPKLGKALAVALLCVKAKKFLIVISPAGCGKSVISRAIAPHLSNKYIVDSVTTSGLKYFEQEFTNFDGCVLIDDIGKIDTPYSRIATLATFAELVYSHYVSKHNVSINIEIGNFKGTAIANLQPVILAQILQHSEWESNLQDKSLRYYHLFRPITPNPKPPDFEWSWGESKWHDIPIPDDLPNLSELKKIGAVQWSRGRVKEHIDDLLRATAALDCRKVVEASDVELLIDLFRPLRTEKYLFEKTSLEAERTINANLLAVLVEIATWKNPTLDTIATDYKVTTATVYRVLSKLTDWFYTEEKSPKTIKASPKLREVLKQIGGS